MLVLPQFEPSLDNSLLGTRTHHRTLGTSTHKKRDGGDDQCLARAGLAGEHRHARTEFEAQLRDDAEIADPQFRQHDQCPGPVIGIDLPVGEAEFGLEDGVEVPGAEHDQTGDSVGRSAGDLVAGQEIAHGPPIDHKRCGSVIADGESDG